MGNIVPARLTRLFVSMLVLEGAMSIAAVPAKAGAPGAIGDLYVAGGGNTVVQYDGTTGAAVGTFASGGGLNAPQDLAFGPDGNLFVSSYGTNSVLEYDGSTGAFVKAITSSELSQPLGVTFGPNGNLFVSSGANDRVLEYDAATGTFVGTFVTAGLGGLNCPHGLTFGPNSNLFVVSLFTDSVLEYDGSSGTFVGSFASAAMDEPHGITFGGPNGNLLVGSQQYNPKVVEFDGSSGAFIRNLTPVVDAHDVAFGPDGNLFVANGIQGDVLEFDSTTGQCLGSFASGGGLGCANALEFKPVPEPGGLAMLGIGSLALLSWRRPRV